MYREVDDNLYYSELTPLLNEWRNVFNDDNLKFYGKFQVWSKCNNNGIIRSYYYIDSDPNFHQFVNNNHAISISNYLEIYLNDNIKIKTEYTRAGGEFYININQYLNNEFSDITISIKGFTKYIKIPLHICNNNNNNNNNNNKLIEKSTVSPRYIMSIWTYDYNSINDIKLSIDGLVKHFHSHSCILNIEKYEVLVQSSYIKYYMENSIINKAVSLNQITFIIKNNHFTQYNQSYYKNECKYYSVYMNLQILQYWNFNVRLFFWDTDEYINVSPFLLQELHRNIRTYSIVSFQRKSVICLDCNASYPDYKFSFNKHNYGLNEKHNLAKVSLNPNEAGLMLIHFALNNNGTRIRLDSRIAYIVHFENYYNRRIAVDDTSYQKFDISNLYSCDYIYMQQQQNNINSVMTINRYRHILYNSLSTSAVSFYFQFEKYLLFGMTIIFLMMIIIRIRKRCF